MRSLVEVMKTSAEDLPQIYCDMDGVLCDFIKGANAAVKYYQHIHLKWHQVLKKGRCSGSKKILESKEVI